MEKRMFLLVMLCLFAVFVSGGCATTSSTTKTETVTTQETKGDSIIKSNQDNIERGETSPKAEEAGTTKVEKRTEVEEKRVESESRGVLGTTVHFIGQVLAFPFKVIAGVIEFVF